MKRVPQRAFHGMNYDGTLAGTGLDVFLRSANTDQDGQVLVLAFGV